MRPWKLASLGIGLLILVAGSMLTPAPDWDIPVSFIMGLSTYITAPCSLRVLLERRWRHFPIALLAIWISVDGFYSGYWYLKNPAALDWMRSANAKASFLLYLICGVIWLHRGTLREKFH